MLMYSFLRAGDSLLRWFWLAIIISGRSQVVRISRGADSESEKKLSEKIRPVSVIWFSIDRLIRLINRLWMVVLIQTMLFLDNHVSGSSMAVGRMIFSIVGG